MSGPADPNPFQGFYKTSAYLELKNHLYNYRLRRSAIRKKLSEIQSPGLILEIGSGVSIMTDGGDNVLYSDITEDAMDYLQKQKKATKTVVMSITDLSLRNNCVGTVVCSEVLEHVKNDTKAIQELHRALQPDGALILTVPVNPNYYAFDDRFVKHERRYAVWPFVRKLYRSGFREFQIVKVTGVLDKLATWSMTRIYSLAHPQAQETTHVQNTFWVNPVFLILYKILNRIFSLLVSLEGKLLPISSTAVVMIYAKKKDLAGGKRR